MITVVVEHSVTQTYRQFYAANEQRTALRTKWAEFFRSGDFDAVLMPIYPLPAIKHDQGGADDVTILSTILTTILIPPQ